MAAMADAMAQIVKQGSSLELNASLDRQMMNRLQVIEEHKSEFANMLGMALVVVETAAKTTGGDEQLASIGVVTMGLFAGEGVAGNFAKQAFAETDAGNGEGVNVEIAAKGDEDERGHGHDVGAIAADAVSLHAGSNVAFEDVGEALAKKRNFQSGQAVLTRTGSYVGEGFGVATEGDSDLISEVRAVGKTRLKESTNVAANLFGLNGTNDARDVESRHQADGAQPKLGGLRDRVIAKDA